MQEKAEAITTSPATENFSHRLFPIENMPAVDQTECE
jgi:hypothetical protein